MKAARERTTDRNGTAITAGMKVKVIGEDGQPEGTVVRVLDDYGVVTVLVPEGRGQAERMYRTGEVAALSS